MRFQDAGKMGLSKNSDHASRMPLSGHGNPWSGARLGHAMAVEELTWEYFDRPKMPALPVEDLASGTLDWERRHLAGLETLTEFRTVG